MSQNKKRTSYQNVMEKLEKEQPIAEIQAHLNDNVLEKPILFPFEYPRESLLSLDENILKTTDLSEFDDLFSDDSEMTFANTEPEMEFDYAKVNEDPQESLDEIIKKFEYRPDSPVSNYFQASETPLTPKEQTLLGNLLPNGHEPQTGI